MRTLYQSPAVSQYIYIAYIGEFVASEHVAYKIIVLSHLCAHCHLPLCLYINI